MRRPIHRTNRTLNTYEVTPMPKVRSRAQAGLFGIIAGGGRPTRHKVKTRGKGALTQSKAQDALRGKKLKRLPRRKR